MASEKQKSGGYDYMLLIPTIILFGIGLIAIYSSSSYLAAHKLGDSYYYLKKQAAFGLVGLFMMILVKNIPVNVYRKFVYPALVASFILLVALFIPGLGRKVGGACRWMSIGGINIQPSELTKISLVIYMAYSMSKKGVDMASFTRGLLPHVMIVGTFMVLILLQPDLGTTIIIGGWMLILLFVGGLSMRWLAFMNPWEDPQGMGFQIIHSFLAFGSGGIFGVGLGNSKQKLLYLPEPHTDFVLSIVAEELGFVGLSVIVVLFGLLIIRGIKVSLDAPDLYSSYLALGISTLIGLQVVINMGVVTGLLPTKGLTLPFMSYGGSSLLVNLIGVGMLLSISEGKQGGET